jgi:hypothetical protein
MTADFLTIERVIAEKSGVSSNQVRTYPRVGERDGEPGGAHASDGSRSGNISHSQRVRLKNDSKLIILGSMTEKVIALPKYPSLKLE